MRLTKCLNGLILMFLITVISLAPLFSCFAQARVVSKYPNDINISANVFKLENGLTVIVSEDASTPSVGVELWFRAGSRYEKKGQYGYAHLFEHMMPRSSHVFSNQENLSLYREQVLDSNAQTKSDYSRYYLKTTASSLELALATFADRMSNSADVITQAELDRHREIVINEIRNTEGKSWDSEINNHLREGTFGDAHPYGHSVYGTIQQLREATVETMRDWYKTYHGAANAVLIVSGNVKTENVREMASRLFGDIAPGQVIARQTDWLPPKNGWRRDVMWHNVNLPKVYVNWTATKYGTPDADYLLLLQNILVGDENSRLHKRLVNELHLADSIFTNSSFSEMSGVFSIGANLKESGDADKAEKIILEEVNRTLREGITPIEIERAKANYKREFIENLQQLAWQEGRAEVFGEGWLYTGDPNFFRIRLDRIQKATAKDLSDAARRWLSDSGFVLAVNKKENYQTGKTIDRTSRVNVAPATLPTFPDVQEKTLPNGLRILLVEKHNLPLVKISLLVNTELPGDKTFQPGISALTLKSLRAGTSTRDAAQIDNLLSLTGSDLQSVNDLNLSALSLSTLKEQLDKTLPVFADIVFHPSFPTAEFEKNQRALLEQIKRENNTPADFGKIVLSRMLYGESHPYGQNPEGIGTESSVRQIKPADLAAFHKALYRPNNATLIIVGDVTAAELMPKLTQIFGGWTKGTQTVTQLPETQSPSKPVIYLIDQPNASQSLITAAQILPRNEIAEMPALGALENILALRLNSNLRESKRWTYGAWTTLSETRDSRVFSATAPVQADKTIESMREILNEFKKLKEQPISPNELKTIRRSLIRNFDVSTLNDLSSLLTKNVRFGLPVGFYKDQIARTGSLSENEIPKFASKTLTPERFVWIVVADRKTMETVLRESGIGEVKVITNLN